MRFELKCALKYLVPKWRQLSVSIISLLSIGVISLVVWLVIVFLSVTEGIEKKWVDELVALNAPLRMVPTEAYYHSYYYQIDSESSSSNFSCKSIGEKLSCPLSDPYDLSYDPELPLDFPTPDLNAEGELKDPVKEAWHLASSFKDASPKEYEVSFGNLRLSLLRKEQMGDTRETVLSQVSYITSFDGENKRLTSMFLPTEVEGYSNLLASLEMPPHGLPSTFQARVIPFFRALEIESVKTASGGWQLPPSSYPAEGKFRACALMHQGKVFKVFISKDRGGFDQLLHSLTLHGFDPLLGDLYFDQGELSFLAINGGSFSKMEMSPNPALYLEEGAEFSASFNDESIQGAHRLSDLRFTIDGDIQGVAIKGEVPYRGLVLGNVSPIAFESAYWVHQKEDGSMSVPSNNPLGDGILLPKSYQENGAMLGDSGTICYTSEGASSMQEMRLPVYVAGFYDPGLLPVGNRVVLADPKVTAALRSDFAIADQMLGNGIAVWVPNLKNVDTIKASLIEKLQEKGIDQYWDVTSYADYELTAPILQQLKSDKTLFSLIAMIILIVACSNIISMLILLVNDKRKEIAILQSLGASPMRIATLFGLCGLITGFLSSLIGTVAALITLRNLQSLVGFLNFLQGHEAFHQAFYGNVLPNTLSLGALGFVIVATVIISVLAGVVPAIKAAKIRPSQILRSE